jgi:Mg2+ and Co2+ transporter CorA
MPKVTKLTENDLNRIVKKVIQEQEQNEIFGGLKDMYHGVRGFSRGEGYQNFKNLSTLTSIVKKLKKLDEPNHKVMTELQSLKTKISSAQMRQDSKQFLLDAIDRTTQYFNSYASALSQIESVVSNKLT